MKETLKVRTDLIRCRRVSPFDLLALPICSPGFTGEIVKGTLSYKFDWQ
jgi:hypothetical protein